MILGHTVGKMNRRADNRSQCSLYPASNQRATSQPSQELSTQMKNQSHTSRIPSLDHHATQQNGKHHFRQRLSRYGIEDCSYSPDAQRTTPIQRVNSDEKVYQRFREASKPVAHTRALDFFPD
ncbi:hypothetical protein TNCV_2151891 [Trichonephila clavipes]|uniref:Uncharacterized protein n=1 Tax=Trichonephila clavipes TaxID=2585209 RepID=A0A8X6UPE7_TRICX|nr:hypothetical protein TNCV_2151891 [Trichonephila clavipes]